MTRRITAVGPHVHAGAGRPLSRAGTRPGAVLAGVLLLLLAAMMATNALSASMRHREAGLGCEPWPACYGMIGERADRASTRGPVAAAFAPRQAMKQAHRLLAGAAFSLALVAGILALRHPRTGPVERRLAWLLAATMVALAVVGPFSYLKTRPAIAAFNVLGGLAIVAMAWRMLLGLAPPPARPVGPGVARLATLVLALVGLQVALGAWTSANFAAAACTDAWDCVRLAGEPGAAAEAARLARVLALDVLGRVETGPPEALIHLAHRAGALVAGAGAAGLAAVLLTRPGLVLDGAVLLGLLSMQVALGLTAVHHQHPPGTVLAHNLTAAMLLLALVRIHYRTRKTGPD